jgi:leucyl aminopeptidase
MKKKHVLTACLLAVLSSQATAETEHATALIMPTCLTQSIDHFTPLATNANYALVKVNQQTFSQLLHQKKLPARHQCGNFLNVTDELAAHNTAQAVNPKALLQKYTQLKTAAPVTPVKTFTLTHPNEVKTLFKALNPQNMWTDLTKLTAFDDRYANSSTGVDAANWIKSQVEAMAKAANRSDVTATLVATGTWYQQPSVVIKIGTSSESAVVIGAHMDTLEGNMPGADDDGTGTVTVLELARVLINSPMRFKNPIYLNWYSAEEMGLVGSQYVVKYFKHNKIPVTAVMHFDMTGYAHNNEKTMWLVTDNTNSELTQYFNDLITTYVQKPVKTTACGYACSDHATWNSNGYKAAIAFEAKYENYNPNIHSEEDQMQYVSLDHMTDYAKLGLAFAVELGNPVS